MSHSFEDHIGGPVTEETIADFLIRTMPPDSADQVNGRIELLSGEQGKSIAAEVLRIGTPPDHWAETDLFDPQALRHQLITQLETIVFG